MFDGARHGAQGRLVQDVIDARASSAAKGQVLNIAFDKDETFPRFGTYECGHLVKVSARTSGKVVEADYSLAEAEERFHQVGADETGRAGNQPGSALPRQLFRQGFVGV